MRLARVFPTVLVPVGLALAAASSSPAPNTAPKGVPGTSSAPGRSVLSPTLTYLDPNLLSLALTNLGFLAFDVQGFTAGLEYPKGSGKYAMFAAGLWIVANVGDEVRAAVAEYTPEYVPGPMAGGTFLPDDPTFRNYHVTSASTDGYADWMTFAVPMGAPTSAGGTQPLVWGDETAWTVFNDADPAAHTNPLAQTSPLGLEIQLLAAGTAGTGPFGYGLYLDYTLINKGTSTLDSAYVALWSDPDLGEFTDDLTGCDPALDLGFCYNATNADTIYGTNPPAVGIALLEGPRSIGGGPPLGMTGYRAYTNGKDPADIAELHNVMRGYAHDGSPLVDPTTTFPTRTQFAGDPVLGTGWLDSPPGDKRFVVSSGPFHMEPGDTQTVRYAVLVGQGGDRLESITALKSLVQPFVLPVEPQPAPTLSGAALSVFPNPARGRARFDFVLAPGTPYRLELFDAAGRRQVVIAQGIASGALQSELWDAGPGRVARAPAPGVYWAVLSSGERQTARRVVVLDH